MSPSKNSTEGYIYQLPSGRWRAQVCIERRRISATRRTRAEARTWAREMLEKAGMGIHYADGLVCMDEYLESWLAMKKSQVKASTYDGYALSIHTHIIPHIGSIQLADLTPARVQYFLDELVRGGTGVRSVQLARVILMGCLERATRLGIISRNPVEFSMAPKSQEVKLNVWNEQQVASFLVASSGHRNETLYYLALATGMRRGELLGLKWEDIDWLKQRIMICRQVYHKDGGGFIFQEPKTKRGRRSVRVGAGTIEKLQQQQRKVDLLRQAARERWMENDLVFPAMNGTPQVGSHITHDFQYLVRRSGLPHIRLHDCRHTAATIMLNHGIPPVIVAGILGHSLAVLMNTYAHFIPDMQEEAARLMDEVTSPEPVEFSTRVIPVSHEFPTPEPDMGVGN